MERPDVSIIVPVYNVQEYLSLCLDSLIAQTLKSLEIIAIDDGSTDGSAAILDSYEAKDSRIKVIHVKNGGVSKARNIGLDAATGEYVGFVDSDDYVNPYMFQTMVQKANEHSSDCVQCGLDVVRSLSEDPCPEPIGAENLIDGNSNIVIAFFKGEIGNSSCNKLYRRTLIGDLRFPEGWVFAEDFFFNASAMLLCKRVVTIKDVFYHYFMRSGSASHDGISERQLKGFAVYDEVKAKLTDADVVRIVSEKEVSESLRFLDSAIGHKEISKESIRSLAKRIRCGRKWIDGNEFLNQGGRLRARFVCLFPGLYVFAVGLFKKLRRS